MEYKHTEKCNYENYASGRVMYGFPGIPNYPVRLAGEIFSRCIKYLPKEADITLFDPCCGGGYMLTVIGFLHYEKIARIYGSDINQDILELARKNISLLSVKGLLKRKDNIEKAFRDFGKASHKDALNSVKHFLKIIKPHENAPETECFATDILNNQSLNKTEFIADIVIADVPYGKLANWSIEGGNEINTLLSTLRGVIDNNTIIAISSTKMQKIKYTKYKRLEKFNVGKRKIEIIKLGDNC